MSAGQSIEQCDKLQQERSLEATAKIDLVRVMDGEPELKFDLGKLLPEGLGLSDTDRKELQTQ